MINAKHSVLLDLACVAHTIRVQNAGWHERAGHVEEALQARAEMLDIDASVALLEADQEKAERMRGSQEIAEHPANVEGITA